MFIIIIWLHCVFTAALRLFPSCREWGLLSCCRARIPGPRASVVTPRGSAVVAHVLSCSAAWRIFLDQGLNPCLLHWAGGFLSTGPLGKSSMDFLIDTGMTAYPWLRGFMSTHHVCLHSSCRESLDSRILLFPDSLLNQTWWYVQRGNSHKHLSLLHLRVPNPDIDSCWCSLVTVMDLCSAFFPPLIPDSPFLSAIMFRGRQSTWTHVSQGLCEIIFPSL